MNEVEVLESVIKSIPKSRFIYKVEKAIFEIYPGEYVYIKGSGPICLKDFQILDESNLDLIQHKYVIIHPSLIEREGLIAIESYRLRRNKEIRPQKPVDGEISETSDESVKMAIFYGLNNSSSINGSFWTINSFLDNKNFAKILKVEVHKGKEKNHDSFLVYYKLK